MMNRDRVRLKLRRISCQHTMTQMFVYTTQKIYKQLRTCIRRSARLYGDLITEIWTWACLTCVD